MKPSQQPRPPPDGGATAPPTSISRRHGDQSAANADETSAEPPQEVHLVLVLVPPIRLDWAGSLTQTSPDQI